MKKISPYIFLIIVFTSLSCVQKTSDLHFEVKEIPNPTGDSFYNPGGTPSGQGNVSEEVLKATFATTLFPITSTSCFSCHANNHGSTNVDIAFNNIRLVNKVNLDDPAFSSLYTKILDGHQTFNISDANEILDAIVDWKSQSGYVTQTANPETSVVYTVETTKQIMNPPYTEPSGTILITAKDNKDAISFEGTTFNFEIEDGVESFGPPRVLRLDGNGNPYNSSEGLPVAISDTYQGSLPKGRARVQFTITDPIPGPYYIYILANCGTVSQSLNQTCGGANQFYASVNAIVAPEITLKHTELYPTAPILDPYLWRQLEIPLAVGKASSFQLGAGNHELTIVPRTYGFRISQIAITKDANFIANTQLWDKAKILTYNLDHIYAGLKFMVSVSEFDNSSYLLSKPRFLVPVGKKLRLKNILASLNSGIRTQDTWSSVDLLTVPTAPFCVALNGTRFPCITTIPTSQIILKDKGFALDELSFKFETLTIE
jgi:hypothetical protein